MKKLFVSLILCFVFLFLCNLAFAGPVKIQILDASLDDDPTTVTGTAINIHNFDKVSFFVHYNETEVGNSISAEITFTVSFDGTNWTPASFFDYAGGSTLQTSQTITQDSVFFCWFDRATEIPRVRMAVAATNTDADDTLEVDGFLSGSPK